MSGKGSKNSIDFAFRRKQSPIARNEQCIGLSASLGDVRRITTPADNDSGDTTSEGGASYRTESDTSGSSLSRSESTGKSSKGKLKIWKKVKRFGQGSGGGATSSKKRDSNESADLGLPSSPTPDLDDVDGFDYEGQVEELDQSPMHSRSQLSIDPLEAASVRSVSPLPPITPDSAAHSQSSFSEPPPNESSTESTAGRLDRSASIDADMKTPDPLAASAPNPMDAEDVLRRRSAQGVSPSRSFAGPFDTAFAGAQREHRRSEPMHGAMLKPQLGNSASHDLSPLRKRLGATVGATGTAPSSFDETPPQTQTQHGFPYILAVTIVSGHSLVARDSNGLSDPYVKMKIGSGYSKAKTTIVHKSLSPIWNESFDLGVYSLDDSVLLRVYDHDLIGSDDSMGRTVVNLAKLPLEVDTELRLGLESTDGHAMEELGYIMVRLHIQSVENLGPSSDKLLRRKGTVWQRTAVCLCGHRKCRPSRLATNITSTNTTTNNTSTSTAATAALGCFESGSTQKKPLPLRRRSSGEGVTQSGSSCHLSSRKCGAVARSILSVTLLSGSQLAAMDENGFSDPYCKFRLGAEKWKSRIITKSLNPEWKEKFEMRMIDGASDILYVTVFDKDYASKDDFMGSCEVDIASLAPDVTHNLTKTLADGEGEINFLLTITGLKDPSDFAGVDPQDPESLRTDQVLQSYCLQKTMTDLQDVGILMVKVIKAAGLTAADIGGTSDPFVTIELGNSMVRTETVYKTVNPEWGKVFFLKVKDIHSQLDITVSDEDRDKSEFLGRIKIPLLSIIPGETRWYALKDTKLRSIYKGQLELQFDLIYNPIRASIRTFNPSEKKYIEESEKFSRQVLSANITRVMSLVRTVSAFVEFINSLFLWKHKLQTSFAFLIFVAVVLTFDLWMVFAFLLSVFMVQYFRNNVGATNQTSPYQVSSEDTVSSDDDEDHVDKKGLRQRLQDLYNICLTVQNGLDMVAGLGERVKNTVNWTIPFQSWLAMAVLTIAMVVTYLIPLRYLVLLWGINKFTKRLRKPNFIPNNELLDFLSRTPSDPELVERSVVTAAVNTQQKSQKKKKKR
ncbi:multiple C2 and transmembrane domain-containing protein 2-like isoform X2 [Sycon ciliatum]|uniref:multiple C2 and transmembrane domain-containing protein 2-like isoform X2 n=1 Tax=Sycon ciliatum TaxID=27933 RepID=UPI0031F7011D